MADRPCTAASLRYACAHATFQDPWQRVQGDEAGRLEAELMREICATHRLAGCDVEAVARRIDCDDVLLIVEGASTFLAVVHLTYSKEADPQWPSIEAHRSFDSWWTDSYLPDVKEYSS